MPQRASTQRETPALRRRLIWARRWRGLIARHLDELAAASHHDDAIIRRELLPLLAAIRWHEREAPRILAPRPARGRPVWLAGVRSVTHRAPLGRVVIVARSCSPLLPMGVDLLGAVVAGNRVTVDLDPRWARGQALLVELARAAWDSATSATGWIEAQGPTPDELAVLRDGAPPAGVIGHADRRRLASLEGWAHSEGVRCAVRAPSESVAVVAHGADVGAAARSVVGALVQGLVGDWVRPRRVLVDRREAVAFERAIRPLAAGVRPMRVRAPVADEAYSVARVALGHHARSASGVVESPTTGPSMFRPLVLFDPPPRLKLASEPVPVAPVSFYKDASQLAGWLGNEADDVSLSVFGGASSVREVLAMQPGHRSISVGHWAGRLVHPGAECESALQGLTRPRVMVSGGGLGEIGDPEGVGWIARLYKAGTGGAKPDLEIRPEPVRRDEPAARGRGSGGRVGRRKGGRQRQP